MRTREVLRALKKAGFHVEQGTKHHKVYTKTGELVGVVSTTPRFGEHDPHYLKKLLKKGSGQ